LNVNASQLIGECNSAFTLGHISPDKSFHVRLKTLLAALFNGRVHTLATCGAICLATCVECEQCRFTCVDTHLKKSSDLRPFNGRVHTLATCGAICLATCVECEQCRFACVDTHLKKSSDLRPSVKAL